MNQQGVATAYNGEYDLLEKNILENDRAIYTYKHTQKNPHKPAKVSKKRNI